MEKRTRIIDDFVVYGYENGFWQSLIIHCTVLLIMSFLFIVIEKRKPPIVIQLSSLSDVVEYNNANTEDLELEVDVSHFNVSNTNNEIDNQLDIISDVIFQEEEPVADSSDASDIVSIEESLLLDSIDNKKSDMNQMFSEAETPQKIPSTEPMDDNPLKKLVSQGVSLGQGQGKAVSARTTSASTSPKSIEEKIQMYGAGTGDVQISLSWSTADDIDLHVQYIGYGINEVIFWRRRLGSSGAILDIDMNARGPQNRNPIENIFWPYNSAPRGRFMVGVHFFRSWTRNTKVPVIIRIKTLKGTYTKESVAILGQDIQVIETFTN